MQVEVVAEVDGWLHCVASNGAKGLVPSSYVRLLGAGEMAGLQKQPSSVVSMHASAAPTHCQLCRVMCHLGHITRYIRVRLEWQAALLIIVHIASLVVRYGTAYHAKDGADCPGLTCAQRIPNWGNASLFEVKARTYTLLLHNSSCAVQMASQPSFDPLAGPDPLAAFTRAREPSNSWMSFDDEDATSAGPFHQGSMASNVDAKSMDAASGQVFPGCTGS